jgi:hypothetical protein
MYPLTPALNVLAVILLSTVTAQEPLRTPIALPPEYTQLKTLVGLNGEEAVGYRLNTMKVDADGAPNAYHPENIPEALDHLANAGAVIEYLGAPKLFAKDGESTRKWMDLFREARTKDFRGYPKFVWWGIVHDNGKPIEQTTGKYAGYYISETTLTYRDKPERSLERQVDSATVPYLALPRKLAPADNGPMRLGDLAVVLDEETGRHVYAIIGDTRPAEWAAEGSVCLAERIGGGMRSGRRAGYDMERNCTVLVFPYSGDGRDGGLAIGDINARGAAALDAWGGIERLKTSVPLLPEP